MFSAERLQREIEAIYPVGPTTNGALAVTGEPYVVIGDQSDGRSEIPGTVDEGAERDCAFDEETAYFAARAAFNTYAHGRSGILYWRVAPILEWNEARTRCRITMRCLISDKPRLRAA
jgi:hypothetical protein